LTLGGLVVVYLFVVVASNMPSHWTSSVFNPHRLLQESDVVCKGKVQVWLGGVYASIHTLSRIKGDAPDHFIVKYTPNALLDLAPGETAILFLKDNLLSYRYAEPHNGKITAVDVTPSKSYGDQPEDRLLSELVQTAISGEGPTRYNAIEQIGKLGDPRAKDVLASLCNSDDIAAAGMSFAARIRVGDAPDVDALLAYVKRKRNDAEEARAVARFRTNGYRLTRLQSEIFQALDGSVKRDPGDGFTGRFVAFQPRPYRTGPVQKLENFDYVAFFTEALKLPSLQTEEDMRHVKEDIARAISSLADKRSLPLVRELMNDPDFRVRYTAMMALVRIFGEGEGPSVDRFRENESIYRAFWEQKLAAQAGNGISK